VIALWLAYGAATGGVIALVGWLIERACQQVRLPTRWIWMGVICTSIGSFLVVAAVAPRNAPPPPSATPSSMAPRGLVSRGTTVSRAGAGGDARRPPSARMTAAERIASVAQRWVADPRSARMDRALAIAWAATTMLLLVVVAHGARGVRVAGSPMGPDGEHVVDGIRVRITEAVGPAAVGVRRPLILLPRWTSELAPHLRALVMLHEREHVASGDPAMLLSAVVLVTLFPWSPALWWALHRLRLSIEMDCDARVLRRHPDIRQYGQLLLFVSQHGRRERWTHALSLITVASLRLGGPHLSHRIIAMTRTRTKRSAIAAGLLLVAAVVTGSLAFTFPVPHRPTSPGAHGADKPATRMPTRVVGAADSVRGMIALKPNYALVKRTENGSATEIMESERNRVILIYTVGPAAFGIDNSSATLHGDTLRVTMPAVVSVNLTAGEVHFVSLDRRPFDATAILSGGNALELSAEGRHIALRKGGEGIHSQ
jgi:beta-lactamase regulating signal transducer with metallopeptidase domain